MKSFLLILCSLVLFSIPAPAPQIVSNAPSVPSAIVYSTISASSNNNLGPITVATAGSSGNTYRLWFYVDQTVAGTGCTTNTTVVPSVTWTDPNNAGNTTVNFTSASITNNGAVGNNLTVVAATFFAVVRAKASTVVQYSVTYTVGTCTTGPSYQVYPILEQLS